MAANLEKKVLLFGRTGNGKSTLANMLVAGNLENPLFKIGDGMAGVTSNCEVGRGRNYFVVDTVGLGEVTEAEAADPAELIYSFLKQTKGEYSHILFVKAAGRVDKLDKEIWRVFLEVFKGAEPAFGMVVTKCGDNPEKWKKDNLQILKRTYPECQGRFAFVEFPPVASRQPEMEVERNEIRQGCLLSLDAALDDFFERNSFRYHEPRYATLDDTSLHQRANNLFQFILDIARKLAGSETVKALLQMFMPPGAAVALHILNEFLQRRADPETRPESR